jgi:hypothetical protein
MSRGAEGTDRPLFLYSQAISSQDRSRLVRLAMTGQDWSPPGVKFCCGHTYTPQQKIYAKVRSFGNVLFCTHIKVTLVTKRK